MKNIRSELRPGEVDMLSAPEGHYAVRSSRSACMDENHEPCVFLGTSRCSRTKQQIAAIPCYFMGRADKCTVVFKKLE